MLITNQQKARLTLTIIPLRFKLFHDIQEIIVHLRLVSKLKFDLVQIWQCILHLHKINETQSTWYYKQWHGDRVTVLWNSILEKGTGITGVIVSITKYSLVIGSADAHLLRNCSAVTWVSNYTCPIWTFCNWIVVIGQFRCAHVNHLYWIGFF